MKPILVIYLLFVVGTTILGQDYQIKIEKDKNGVINYIKFASY